MALEDKINPEGLSQHTVPSPIGYLESSVDFPVTNQMSGEYEIEKEIEEYEIKLEDEGTVIDRLEDRDHNDNRISRKMRVFYGNGWFNGSIDYYNTVLKEYRVSIYDGTSDYINEEDRRG